MALNSSWAYQNGKRTMPTVKDNLKTQKAGWIHKDGIPLYAERYDLADMLMVKTYPNKEIADAAASGVGGKRSKSCPFTIIKTDI